MGLTLKVHNHKAFLLKPPDVFETTNLNGFFSKTQDQSISLNVKGKVQKQNKTHDYC